MIYVAELLGFPRQMQRLRSPVILGGEGGRGGGDDDDDGSGGVDDDHYGHERDIQH